MPLPSRLQGIANEDHCQLYKLKRHETNSLPIGEYPAGSVGCAEATGELKSGTRHRWFILFTNSMIDFGFVIGAFVPCKPHSSSSHYTLFPVLTCANLRRCCCSGPQWPPRDHLAHQSWHWRRVPPRPPCATAAPQGTGGICQGVDATPNPVYARHTLLLVPSCRRLHCLVSLRREQIHLCIHMTL